MSGGIHHVAYACRDAQATRHFYEDLFGFPLVHTEVTNGPDGFFRHLFFDTGGQGMIAFFDLHGVGEREGWQTDLSATTGVPVWVNHVAFNADEALVAAVRRRMSDDGIEPLMDIDHGWCHSLYYLDPNGIMVELCRDTPGFTPDSDAARAALT